jgi:peptide-methionine (R)-S-oxide reductase
MGRDELPVERTEEEWRAVLAPEQYRVLRQHGTERPGSSPLNAEARTGEYLCAGCGGKLFESETKFDAHCGWPSFDRALEGATETSVDNTHSMTRTEVHCAKCGGHLGHVFPDGPTATGLRYCMNGAALNFKPGEA